MKAIVIYESLTGNTRDAGHLIASGLSRSGVEAVACPITEIHHQSLSEADLVVVGSWTDGLFLFGQKPGRIGRLANLPVIDGKKAAVYCTYAIRVGKTLPIMSRVIGERGGEVIGGYAIKRDDLAGGAEEFVERLLAALDTDAAAAEG